MIFEKPNSLKPDDRRKQKIAENKNCEHPQNRASPTCLLFEEDESC